MRSWSVPANFGIDLRRCTLSRLLVMGCEQFSAEDQKLSFIAFGRKTARLDEYWASHALRKRMRVENGENKVKFTFSRTFS